jgi:hypothetical protein
LYAGALACIGQGCTLNPSIINAIQDRYESGDRPGALDAQRSANHLVQQGVCTVEWFKRYCTEQGYPVPPYARSMGANPYFSPPGTLSHDAYHAFKRIYEAELARYSA